MTSTDVDRASAMTAGAKEGVGLDHTATAYGIAAAVAIVFNTLLAWVKDAYDPLNTAMAKTLGHHWTTHGVVVVLVFLVVGFVLSRSSGDLIKSPYGAVYTLCAAVVLAGSGLAGWFLLM
jgi:hypothetical protein